MSLLEEYLFLGPFLGLIGEVWPEAQILRLQRENPTLWISKTWGTPIGSGNALTLEFGPKGWLAEASGQGEATPLAEQLNIALRESALQIV